MDRFVSKRSAPSPTVSTRVSKKPKVSDKQGEKSADYRAKEFGAVFYTSGGNFSAKPCNTVVDHVRKLKIYDQKAS